MPNGPGSSSYHPFKNGANDTSMNEITSGAAEGMNMGNLQKLGYQDRTLSTNELIQEDLQTTKDEKPCKFLEFDQF